jgi:hypothetical protein
MSTTKAKKEAAGRMMADVSTGTGFRIFCYGRGFVIIADTKDISRKQDEFGVDYFEVRASTTIRTWGTSRGLTQLCYSGPLDETVLDPNPATIEVPLLAIHDMRSVLPAVEDKWRKVLDKAFVEVLGK